MISLCLRNLPEIKVSFRGFANQAPDTSGRYSRASLFTGSVCYIFHLPRHFLHLLSNAVTKLAKTGLGARRRHPSNKGQDKQKGLWTHRTSSPVRQKHHWQHRGKQNKQYQKHKFNHFNYLNSSWLGLKLANRGKKSVGERRQGVPSLAGEVHAWPPWLGQLGAGGGGGGTGMTMVPWHHPPSATRVRLWKTMSSAHVAMMINIFSETSVSEKRLLLMSGRGTGYVHSVKPASSVGLLNTPTTASDSPTDTYRVQSQHPGSGGKPEQLCSLQMQRDRYQLA